MVDLRKDKRAPASLKVKYKSVTVDQFIDQFGTDVSRGGIFVKTKKPIEIGALLKLELQLNDASPVIHGIGRVCWRREPGPDPNLSAGMGIKFIKLDPDSRTIVERIVQQRGDRPSRFEQTTGAEIAPPSISPPPASGAPPPITVPPPSQAPSPIRAAAPIATKPTAPAIAAPAAPRVPARAAVASPAAVAATASTPLAPAKVAPAAPAHAVRPPAAPMPAAPSAASPSAAAPSAAAAAKPAPAKPAAAGSRAVAGLFADSPLSRSTSGEPGAELRARSSFFPPAPSNNGSGSSSRPSSSRPTSGRSEQARQSGQFLATAFAEGGLAEDTTAQARAAAEAGTDELLDELFDEVVKTSEHPAPPPAAASSPAPALRGASSAGAARVSQPSPVRESVDDMFAELSEEEGLPPSSPALQMRKPDAFPSAPAARAFPSAPAAPDFDEERTTVRTSVDELLDGLDDEAAAESAAAEHADMGSAPALRGGASFAEQAGTDDDDFGEADVFATGARSSSGLSPSDPPAPRILSSTPAAPPDVANAMQRRSSALPLIIVLLLAAGGAGLYFYQANQVARERASALAPVRPAAAPAAAPGTAAQPGQPTPDPAAAAPAEPDGKSAADPTAAAPGAAPTPAPAHEAPAAAARNVEVEVSSDPRGAEITVDGKPVGNAPARVTLVVDKPSEVKVSALGFAPAVRSLVPSANNEPLRFKLEPLPYTLVVRSTPPQASLAVGDHVALAPAPLDLGHLDGGVQVSISKDGYQRMTRLVRLDEFSMQGSAMRAEIDVTLSPLPGGDASHARPRSRARTAVEAPPAPSPEPETSAPSAPSEHAPAEEPAPAAAKPAPADPAPAAPAPE